MKEPIFYAEWLPLEKKQFRILALLAVLEEFNGSLSDMCRHFQMTEQSRNRNALRGSIDTLAAQNFLTCKQSGRTYHLIPVPKEHEIRPLADVTQAIMRHEYNSENVAWDQVLKVYLWICHNKNPIITDAEISADLCISPTTIGAAKNVLEKDLNIVDRKIRAIKLNDGSFKRIGQTLETSAWWERG